VNIQPIIFAAPSAPITRPATIQPSAEPSVNWLPWIAVALLVGLIAWKSLPQSADDVPGPSPVVVIDEATANVVADASRSYAAEMAKVMDELAGRVDARAITNWDQLSVNARALSTPARERAFAPVDVLDTAKIPSGEWDANRSIVSAHLRSKAEGHRRASK